MLNCDRFFFFLSSLFSYFMVFWWTKQEGTHRGHGGEAGSTAKPRKWARRGTLIAVSKPSFPSQIIRPIDLGPLSLRTSQCPHLKRKGGIINDVLLPPPHPASRVMGRSLKTCARSLVQGDEQRKKELGSRGSPAYEDRQILVWGHRAPEASPEELPGAAGGRV